MEIIEEKIEKGKLNNFLIFILLINAFRSVIVSITEIIQYNIDVTAYGKNYFEVFCIIEIVIVLVHILGISITLIKKSIIGIFILFGNFLFSIMVSYIINLFFNFEIINIQRLFINALIQFLVISSLLMLKSEGVSAYSTLWKNYTNNKKVQKPKEKSINIQSIIIYGLLAIVIIFCIYSIFTLL